MRLAPLLAVVVVGCVHTNAAVLDPSLKLAPVCPDGVVVFTDSSKVSRPYREVAVLNSRGDNNMTSEGGMINSQRKKAAALGANGIILGSMKDAGTGAQVWHALIGPSANRKGGALAIYIPSDSGRVAEACKVTSSGQASRN